MHEVFFYIPPDGVTDCLCVCALTRKETVDKLTLASPSTTHRRAVGRLVLVTATATLCLSLQGARVEAGGRRTEADPHWFRSLSYFRIGWNWIKRALEHGDPTVPTPRGHLGLRVSVMSFVSQPSKRGWDKSLPLGIVPALDSLVNRVDRTPRNTSNLSNTQEGDHQVLLTKKSIRIQGLF